MNILLSGGTGFIGKRIINHLTDDKNHVFIITRNPRIYQNTGYITFISPKHPVSRLPRIHKVINLAGESLFGYWTKKKKDRILHSRINATQGLIKMIKQMEKEPDTFISGSAVGYYGVGEDIIFTEETDKIGDDFLAHIVTEWEHTASQAEDLGIRTVYTRLGVVLGDEGALPMMTMPVKMGVGGPIGSGKQWLSWIHIDDAVELILCCLFNKDITGPVNVTSPYPKRNKDFNRILAQTLNRPYWLTTPQSLINLILGGMSILVTKGQYALPQKAQESGFKFKHPHLREALEDIYNK